MAGAVSWHGGSHPQQHGEWWKLYTRVINVLVFQLTQVETAGGEGSTGPLHDAAKRGNLELVRECLRFAGYWLYYFHSLQIFSAAVTGCR